MMPSLAEFDILSHLSAPQLETLESCSLRHAFPAGEAILHEGETSREAFFIEEGQVTLQRGTAYGQYVLGELGPGELFGEMSFIDREARSVDALAIGDTSLLVLDPKALERAAEHDRVFEVALYWTIWRSLSAKLRSTNDSLSRFFVDAPREHPSSVAPAVPPVRLDIEARRAVFRELELSNMEVNFLASLSEAKKLEPNQPLFYEGESARHAYVVVDGRIMISKMIPEAGEEALAFLERGEIFGEMALVDGQARSADARADEEGATILCLRKEVFDKLLDIEKSSSIRLLKILCRMMAERLRETNEKIIGWYILSGGSASTAMPHERSEDPSSARSG